jgi:hypothetical protein
MGCQSSKPVTEALTLAQLDDAIEKLQTLSHAQLDDALEKMQTLFLAQLNEALNPIKTEIDSMKQESREQFDLIKALLLVPNGDKEAKQATVVITVRNGNNDGGVLGHGVVVCAPDHSRMGVKPKFFFFPRLTCSLALPRL